MYVVLMEHWFGLSGVLRELNNLKEVLWIDLLGVDIWPHHFPCPNLVRSPGWGTHSHVTHPFDLDVGRSWHITFGEPEEMV